MEDELRVETDKHRHTRDELKSAKANLQYTKTQFAVSACPRSWISLQHAVYLAFLTSFVS